jgi:hypothetical protein
MSIPPGIYDQVCKIINTKIDVGVYEHLKLSYHLRWFTVLKKGGTVLQIVHSLKPLNAVTIQHSAILPFTDQLAKHFAGRACGGILNLYVGYNERAINEGLCNYTTFQTPFGAFQLVTLPMGSTLMMSHIFYKARYLTPPYPTLTMY